MSTYGNAQARPIRVDVNAAPDINPNTADQVPKDTDQRPPTPPPAYTPPHPRLQARRYINPIVPMAQASQYVNTEPMRSMLLQDGAGNLVQTPIHSAMRPNHSLAQFLNQTAPVRNEASGDNEDGDEDTPITIHINTTVNVCEQNNLVSLADSPSNHAIAIGDGLMRALRQGSAGQCGLPMIDEDGRPRRVHIEIDSGLLVRGSGNVVGSEGIIQQFLQYRSAAASSAPAAAPVPSPPASTRGNSAAGVRRQRDESVEEDDAAPDASPKRRRSE